MQFPTAPAAASFWVPRLYFPNGKLACNCLLLPLQLFRNESLKCDINQDKMQKMQLDTGFNQKCTKKTEEEAFRMLLYGCSWKRCCAIIGQQKKYIHKLHILTTPYSTLISVIKVQKIWRKRMKMCTCQLWISLTWQLSNTTSITSYASEKFFRQPPKNRVT